MRKFSIVLGLMAVSFLVVSCFNLALPEKVHVKAAINPNIPLNKASFNLSSQIQKELANLFADGASKVINYLPESDTPEDPQKFLISFTMMEQSLNFQDYFNQGDLGKDLEAINQKFKIKSPEANDTKIAIDMTATIANILANVTSTQTVPVNTSRIAIPLRGFSNLSFHSGYLDISFSISAGQNYTATLRDLKVNNRISATNSSYTLADNSRTVTVTFPLAEETLSNTLTLTYSSPNTSSGNRMVVATKIRQGSIIKTAKGVNFNPDRGPLSGSDIDLKLSAELVQATIQTGSVTLGAGDVKDIDLKLIDTKLTQDNNTAAAGNYKGVNLQTGLNTNLTAGSSTDLKDQLLNPKAAKVAGSYSISVTKPDTSEITFNGKGELEIPINFTLENFSKVYINSKTMIDNFNAGDGGSGKTIKNSLGDLSKTVKSITYKTAGLKFTFGKVIKGLNLEVSSPTFFKKGSKTKPIEANTTYDKEFTETYKPSEKMDNITANTAIEFNLKISTPADTILMLENVKVGEDVTVIECKPEFVFEWVEATINPGKGTDVTAGRFPVSGDGFSLGNNNKLDSILKGLKFEKVNGYLFFTGPESSKNSDIKLELISYPDKNELKRILYDKKINIVQTKLEWPENDKPFTGNIDGLKYSTYESDPNTPTPIVFTETFNNMLSGEPLSIKYGMSFSNGFTIQNNNETKETVFKAVLVLVIPLELGAKNGATLDVSEYLKGMIGNNLLGSLGSNDGDAAKISFNTLTLNVGLTGTPLNGANGKEPELRITAKTDMTESREISIPITSSNVSVPLADYLDGKKQTLMLKKLGLIIPPGGSLKINQGLSLIKLGVNAGVDVTFDL